MGFEAKRLCKLALGPVLLLMSVLAMAAGGEVSEYNMEPGVTELGHRIYDLHMVILIICVVIGEGSSGGALGIGVGDHLAMLQYSTYFVISPEGCANIIWKTSDKAPEAAEAMGVTSTVLQEMGIVDATIPEPLGGAHRDVDAIAARVQEHLLTELQRLKSIPLD